MQSHKHSKQMPDMPHSGDKKGNEERRKKKKRRREANDGEDNDNRKRRKENSEGSKKRKREKSDDEAERMKCRVHNNKELEDVTRGRSPELKPLDTDGKESDGWNPWPDTSFQRHYTHEEGDKSKNFLIHWSYVVTGGSKTGSVTARDPTRGRPSRRCCNGVIVCSNPNRQTERGCRYAIHPMSRPNRIQEQWQDKFCLCGYSLIHIECSVDMVITKWAEGYMVKHSGQHDHPRPPNVTRMDRDAEERFKDLVIDNPDVKPLKLSVGGADREPATKIASVYHNVQRVSRDRQKVLKKAGVYSSKSEGNTMERLADFLKEKGKMVCGKEIGNEIVFTLQNKTMQEFILGPVIFQPGEHLSGLQTDGAHKYFALDNAILICTSTYSSILRRWVPVMFSYSNGSTVQHYYHHFVCLFQSIREIQRIHSQNIDDEDLNMVSVFPP
jgi:hypothetical protein